MGRDTGQRGCWERSDSRWGGRLGVAAVVVALSAWAVACGSGPTGDNGGSQDIEDGGAVADADADAGSGDGADVGGDGLVADAGGDGLGGDMSGDGLGGDAAQPVPTAGPFLASETLGRPLLIAHRGGGRLAPEETLPAYQNAWDLGADMLEGDVHATADGVLVLMHDDRVDRTTDGTGKISSMTFAALRQLDAGYAFTAKDAEGAAVHPFRGQGVVVPTLDEVLDAFPGALWSIEVKQHDPPIAQAVVETLRAHAAGAGPSLDRIIVVSFFDDTMATVRAAAAAASVPGEPALVTGFAAGEMLAFVQEGQGGGYVPPAQVLQLPVKTPEDDNGLPARLDPAHALGLAVQLWTVNDRALMEALVTRPVDGIMTDDPGLLLEVMAEAGLR